MDKRCVCCGLSIEGRDADEFGHSQTPRGPMHFGCRYALMQEAERRALAPDPEPVR